MTQILNGQIVAKSIKENIKEYTDQLRKQNSRIPKLSVILVGEDPASKTYVASKNRQCKEVGIESDSIYLPSSVSKEELIEVIHTLNKDDTVDGILLQLPLPNSLDELEVLMHIDPYKDVDGLHPTNIGLLELGIPRYIPCTPKGIITLLKYYEVDVSGKNALVIGRSKLVGKPISTLLLKENATVTTAHSKTKDLDKIIKEYDIVVVAIGKAERIQAESLAEHQIIIDVGIHRVDDQLTGDVSKESYNKVKAITPVPKGVGPMTIASLLENTIHAYRLKEED